ncbi:MAG: hypothetical protein RLZZ241_1001 [Bacteroidota bacterium]|jgi:hypothetical protein
MQICPECHLTFKGRSDKIFCSDFCRNAHHNRRNRDTTNLIRKVHNRLRRNYRILNNIPREHFGNPIPRSELQNQGFDFQAITGIYIREKSLNYFRIYDLGYTPVNETQILVVSIDEEPKRFD